jgi:hypothetical protein
MATRRKKIYLAVTGSRYEGFDVVGVYTDPAVAKEKAETSNVGYKDYDEVQVFAVNGERLWDDPDEYFNKYWD